MKTWEAFKALAENPTDEYEATRFKKRHVLSMNHTGFYYLDIYNEQGQLIPRIVNGGLFNGNIKPDFEWEKVAREVTWQEAIEAWVNGSCVKSVLNQEEHIYNESQGFVSDQYYSLQDNSDVLATWSFHTLTKEEILDAKWYVL